MSAAEMSEITFEGRPIPIEPGQSIGAALTAAGVRSWAGGLFCGIGVCFGCLVTVNGRPSRRACVTEAHPGDTVTGGGR